MDFKQLEYFLTSVQYGSFTRAAEALYTTQPHVSLVIKSLEEELGIRLLERTASGIRLTGAGEQVRFYAESVLKNAELMRETCEAFDNRCLRIAANPSSSLAFAAGDYLMRYMEEGMDLRYTECNVEEMMRLLTDRQYDLGLLFVPRGKLTAFTHMVQRGNLTFEILRETDLALHAGPGSIYFGKTVLQPGELDGCSCIQFEDDYFSVEEMLEQAKDFREKNCRLRKVVRTNSDHLMIRMLQKTGLCNIGSYWLRGVFGKYDFSMARIAGFEGQVLFGCLRAAHRALRPEAKAFLEMVRRMISEEGGGKESL